MRVRPEVSTTDANFEINLTSVSLSDISKSVSISVVDVTNEYLL